MSLPPELRRIAYFVNRQCPPSLDREHLTTSIWLECREKKIPATPLRIHSRVVDAIRRSAVERKNLRAYRPPCQPLGPPPKLSQTITHAIERAHLSPLEQQLIFMLFYQNLSKREVHTNLGIPISCITTNVTRALSKIGDKL